MVTARRDGIVILNSVVIIHKRKLNNKNRLLCFLAVLSFRSIDSRPKIQAETTDTLLINCFLPWLHVFFRVYLMHQLCLRGHFLIWKKEKQKTSRQMVDKSETKLGNWFTIRVGLFFSLMDSTGCQPNCNL